MDDKSRIWMAQIKSVCLDAVTRTISERRQIMKAFIIGVVVVAAVFDVVFLYAALKVGSDEDDRMGIK